MRGMQRIAIVAFVLAALGVSLGAQGPEGVTVHGHWTIDVKNADGTLVKRHEFENALQQDGSRQLARWLARVTSPGMWWIELFSPAGTPDCGPFIRPCSLSEAGSSLTVSVRLGAQPDDHTVLLVGSLTSPDARSFTSASTNVTECPAATPGCSGTSGSGFTQKDFSATPIVVQPGQIVSVTVAFRFS